MWYYVRFCLGRACEDDFDKLSAVGAIKYWKRMAKSSNEVTAKNEPLNTKFFPRILGYFTLKYYLVSDPFSRTFSSFHMLEKKGSLRSSESELLAFYGSALPKPFQISKKILDLYFLPDFCLILFSTTAHYDNCFFIHPIHLCTSQKYI